MLARLALELLRERAMYRYVLVLVLGCQSTSLTPICDLSTLGGDGKSCSCSSIVDGDQRASAACKPSDIAADAFCCADPEYPSSGTCECAEPACFRTADRCTCRWRTDRDDPGAFVASCAPPAGWVCCANGRSCECSARACDAGAVQVASCSERDIGGCETHAFDTVPVETCLDEGRDP